MDFNIDYGDVGKSAGIERFLMKKKKRIDRFSDQTRELNLDIGKEVARGRSFPSEFSVDLQWIPKHGKAIYVTGRDRNFYKAAAESFDQLVKRITRNKQSFSRDSIKDHLLVDMDESA